MQRLVVVLVAVACGSAKPRPPKPVVFAPSRVAPVDAAAWFGECTSHVDAAEQHHRAILSAPSDDERLAALDAALRELGHAAGLARLTYETHPDDRMRQAGRACEAEMSAQHTALFHDDDVYKLLRTLGATARDPAAQRFIAHALRTFVRQGILASPALRTQLAALDEAINQAGQAIHGAIASDARSFTVHRDRLSGLPPDWIASHPPDAAGEIHISSDPPDILPILAYASDDELRKRAYVLFRSRGDATNEASIATLLELRAQKATRLGFPDWIEYIGDDKMLRGGTATLAFLSRMRELAAPHAAREYGELLALLRQRDPSATAVGDWQKTWLETQLEKQRFGVDGAAVRSYFTHDRVLAGLLALTGELFELEYVRADVAVWHADVLAFDVMRAGTKLGRIFLDLHPRPNKYKHAAMYPIREGGNGVLPEAALVCNFSKGQLDHEEVVLMFHELGHVVHHLLAQQRWITQSGIATESDFAEAPSMMFEEWAWSHDTLARFALHAETGAPIPRPLVEAMQRARRFGTGLWTVQQLFYAAISFEFHLHGANLRGERQLELVRRLQTTYTPFKHVPGTRIHTSFGHLVDYSSIYYTYLWSLVIAKDLLTGFRGNLLDRDAAAVSRSRARARR